MKNVLVAVDFSETSSAALRFGTYLAEVMDLDLRVVHVFDANFSFAQAVSTGALLAEKGRLEKLLKEFIERHCYPVLAKFQGNLATVPAIRSEVHEGFPSRIIRSLSQEKDSEMIIMGGVGAGQRNTPSGIFGGVARSVALHGKCPVLLIPPGYGDPKIKRIALAFGDAWDIRQMSGLVGRLVKVLRAEVNFVHVGNREGNEEWMNDEAFWEMVKWGIGLLVALSLYSIWYMGTYSMQVARAYEVNEHVVDKTLLIVTQQSSHKDQVTNGIVEGMIEYPVNIRVIDLTTAATYQADEAVDACILLHTWEMFRPPGMVDAFRDSLPDDVPLFAITTSGGGDVFLDSEVDGISSASEKVDADWEIRTAVAWARLALGFVPDAVMEENKLVENKE